MRGTPERSLRDRLQAGPGLSLWKYDNYWRGEISTSMQQRKLPASAAGRR